MLQLEQIIKGCKKQKADCQKMLYKQNYSLMLGICLRYGATKEDAEEMLNNGFLKIFVNINQFENKGSFEGWMRRIMANTCLDFLKAKQTKQNKVHIYTAPLENTDFVFENSLYSQGVFSETVLEEKFSKEELLQVLKQLPEPMQTVFNLYIFEEYSHKEIGEMLNMAERTSQWHLSNAKKMLQDIFTKKNNNQAIGYE
jgi:RNA polymerase sigma factor (sigma-70 family)